MEEEKKPVDETTEEEGQAPSNIVDRAELAYRQLDEKLKKLENLKSEIDQAKAEQLLAGSAGGGVPHQRKTDEELKKEQAMDFWKGTGIDKAIEKYGQN